MNASTPATVPAHAQDVALRAYLKSQHLAVGPDGGGDVAINPTENAQTLKLFQDGKLDGAWLPEPWASRLVLQAGAKVLVDEKDLWDGSLAGRPGQFTTTVLIVSRKFAGLIASTNCFRPKRTCSFVRSSAGIASTPLPRMSQYAE